MDDRARALTAEMLAMRLRGNISSKGTTLYALAQFAGGAVGVVLAVAAIITAGYWFTNSTGFAGPAITLARALTDSFSGIARSDAPAFIMAQLAGAVVAALVAIWLFPHAKPEDAT